MSSDKSKDLEHAKIDAIFDYPKSDLGEDWISGNIEEMIDRVETDLIDIQLANQFELIDI